MKRTIEMKGKRFGRLTVIEFAYVDNRREARWICQCDCGNTTNDTRGSQLRRGKATSCGCFRNEQSSIRASKHKKSNTRVYSIWTDMKKRCFNVQCKRYPDYGGRGITVCEGWRNNFEAFYEWSIANGYADNLTIDRIDVNGNYEPSNCRWITIQEQQLNKRNNKGARYDGI
jgi:hypothetical protein